MSVFFLMHLQVHFILQAPWCLSPALMAHTLIRTREAYKKRGSVCPALQGSFAGTLDAPQPLACTSSQICTCHIHPQIQTDMYTHTDTHILYSCIQMQTHAQRHTLISALITHTISRKQECIMFRRHGSLKSQINTLIHMNIMLLWVWEVKIISFSLYLSDEAYILVCSKWSCECECECVLWFWGWTNPGNIFFRGGKIQGVCAAGYLCVSGSADFTPQGPLSNLPQCQWGSQCAGPCPPGTVHQFFKNKKK